MTITAAHVEKVLRSIPGAYGNQRATMAVLAQGANEALHTAGAGLTVKGAAAFLATLSQESGSFRYLTEAGSQSYLRGKSYYPYLGRGFEQVTHKSNYAAFGAWCKKQGLVTDADTFVKNPTSLADIKWAWLGGVWYWQANDLWKYGNRGDFLATQQGVNLGTGRIGSSLKPSGYTARLQWYNAWLKIGDGLLPDSASTPLPAPIPEVPPVALSQTKRVEWKNSGKYVDERTHAQLEAVEEIVGHPIVMYQGSWSNGSLSADTHAGAGAADIGPPSRELETACRKVGLATWWRHGSAWKNNEHCHALSIGNSKMASWAKVQVAAYTAGYDGLGPKARTGKDTGNRSYVGVTWEEVDQEYNMPSADDLVKAMVKSKPLMDALATAVLTADIVPNQFTSNADNPTVSMLTAMDRVGRKLNAIVGAVAPDEPVSESEVKPSAPTV